MSKCDESAEFFDADNNLALHCFTTIETLISYSSHDKQTKLLEVLVQYVLRLKSLSGKGFNERIFTELEAHYTHLIRTIIVKLVSPLKMEDTKNIYEIIVQSFQRRGVYDEGLLALSSMALSN